MKKSLRFLLALPLLLFSFLNAQVTTLGPGDILIISYQSDNPDKFCFIAMDDLAGGLTINFTENGWESSGSFRANEGTMSYTTPVGGLTCGTIVCLSTSNIFLSTSGDQLIAYTGSEGSPTLITAFQGNGLWDSDATSASTSAIPAGLTNDVNAFSFAVERDNYQYAPTGGFNGTKAQLVTSLGIDANWTSDNNIITGSDIPANYSITITDCVTASPCSITGVTLPTSPIPECQGADYVFDVAFNVTNGVGPYEVFIDGTNTVLGSDPSATQITAVISNSTSTAPIMVNVRDAGATGTCEGTAISVTPQDCTPIPCGFTVTPTAGACDLNGEFDLSIVVTPIAPISGSYSVTFDGASTSGLSGTLMLPFLGRTGDGSTANIVVMDDGNAASPLAITAIMPDPASGDNCDEYIEITNSASYSVSLSGYQITDNAGVRHNFLALDILAPGATLRLESRDLNAANCSGGGIWNNSGDTGSLLDASGSTISSLTYSSNPGDDVAVTQAPAAFCVAVVPFTAPTCGIPLTVSAKASCTGANANEWYILVDDVTGGTGAGYNVSAGAFSSAFTGTPVLLGPFTHSGNG
ncbi:MAG: lamin tail domain-containing protein, partial [Bacteroidia bacterium]